ncbi:MAG: 2OG-Fe(II) oxygenase [Gammaproteobacteria bacterium]|nr:2OG-Fe(II) oxygenase [Gammaproteobacteria bacterium]MDH3537501.1 2OG-Fe(II) oxygenase [Gammaproteobacteria bacterium]
MNNLIDLERYPLHRLDSADGKLLVARCSDELECTGMFTLRGFMRSEIIDDILPGLLQKLERESFNHEREHNIYFSDEVAGIPANHPALARVRTVNHTLCGDQLAPPLLQVYRWPGMTEFLARVMQKPKLYPMDDPLACANILGYYEGEGLNWHFDRSEFTTTLLLQAPIDGGEFQYRQALRSDSDQNYDGVARLLRGEDPEVSTLRLGAGDLNVFKGKNTAHRITPPLGDLARLVTVFSYYETPGRRFTDAENMGFYGRINA